MPNGPEIIHRYYAAFNAGDTEGQLALLAEDVRHDVNQGGTRYGKEAFRAFSQHMARICDERCEDVVVMSSRDDGRAAAEFWVHGIHHENGPDTPESHFRRYLIRAGAFFEIRDGHIARITTYYNAMDWKRQVSD